MFLLIPPIVVVLMPHSTKHTNRHWALCYIIVMQLISLTYYLVLLFDSIWIHILFYCACIAGSLALTYIELFIRIISTNGNVDSAIGDWQSDKDKQPAGRADGAADLSQRVIQLMDNSSCWCDPDFTVASMAKELCTNRTTLSSAISKTSYENFAALVNEYRICAFIQLVHSDRLPCYMDAFYAVGYRSRKTALENFRKIKETVHPTFRVIVQL